jgi:hypothetical protein
MRKILIYLLILPLVFITSCNDDEIITPDELQTEQITKVAISKEEKLLNAFKQIEKIAVPNGRISAAKMNDYLLDSALRRIDTNTGSTNYSIYIESNLPHSLTNLVITENEGKYLAFFVDYIPEDTVGVWNLSDFHGLMRLTSIDGSTERIIMVNPTNNNNERTSNTICTTTTWQVTTTTPYGSYTYYETNISCTSLSSSGGGISGFEEYGLNDYSNQLEVYPGKTAINTGGGSENTGYQEEENTLVIISPDRPISNMAEYLKCFNINQSAQITIFVKQPVPNTSNTHNGSIVGHTFVSISQNGNTSVFGFYPKTDDIYPIINPSDPSIMGNDSNTQFDVSITTSVSSSVLQQIINYSIGFKSTYDLNSYNCSDFGIAIGNLAGLNLPDANGTWPGGGGSNPGVLGQHIRNKSINGTITKNTSGGLSPSNIKNCY